VTIAFAVFSSKFRSKQRAFLLLSCRDLDDVVSRGAVSRGRGPEAARGRRGEGGGARGAASLQCGRQHQRSWARPASRCQWQRQQPERQRRRSQWRTGDSFWGERGSQQWVRLQQRQRCTGSGSAQEAVAAGLSRASGAIPSQLQPSAVCLIMTLVALRLHTDPHSLSSDSVIFWHPAVQEFEQLETKLDTTSARKEELDTEIARLSASGDYEALVAATEQLATATLQVRPGHQSLMHGATSTAMVWRRTKHRVCWLAQVDEMTERWMALAERAEAHAQA